MHATDLVTVELRDGRAVHVRPMLESDNEALVRFHDGLSADTQRLRFFNVHPHLSGSEIHRFTHVDHQQREALVALDADEIVAVARYDRTSGTTSAEVAFVVADLWQGHGLGTILLEHIAQLARGQGITTFTADTLSENRKMIDVFHHSGLVTQSGWRDGIIHLELDLNRPIALPAS